MEMGVLGIGGISLATVESLLLERDGAVGTVILVLMRTRVAEAMSRWASSWGSWTDALLRSLDR